MRDRGARTSTSSGELALPPLQPSPTPPRAPRPPIAPCHLIDARSPHCWSSGAAGGPAPAPSPRMFARAAAQHSRRTPPCTTAARPCPPPHARIARAWCGLRSRRSLPPARSNPILNPYPRPRPSTSPSRNPNLQPRPRPRPSPSPHPKQAWRAAGCSRLSLYPSRSS